MHLTPEHKPRIGLSAWQLARLLVELRENPGKSFSQIGADLSIPRGVVGDAAVLLERAAVARHWRGGSGTVGGFRRQRKC